MGDGGVDILMITLNRTDYTRLALTRLFETCNEGTRIWLWQNGTHPATTDLVRSFEGHSNCHKVHYCEENVGQRIPTEWLWDNAEGDYLSKVDDDCLMPLGWIETLQKAHEDVPEFGAICSWAFPPEDFNKELAEKKIETFNGGHQVMLNCWVNGSGYLLKKSLVDEHGFWTKRESFSGYCMRLAYYGSINGWYYPFLYMDHMDHPLSEHTILKTEEAFQKYKPATAVNFGIDTLAAWRERQLTSAEKLQAASSNPKDHLRLIDRVRINIHRWTG